MLPDNLGYLFESTVRLAPERTAILQGDVALTYGELDGRCNRMGGALRSLGAVPGTRVALLFNNDFRFLESLFGIMRIGAVAVPLNLRLGDDALAHVLADAEATVLLTNAALAERAAMLRRRVPAVKEVVGGRDYEELLLAAPPTLDRGTTAFGDICMQPYTSGSTGRPKGVLLTHGGQVWNADMMRKSLLVDETDRALVAVPLFHKNAMAGAVKPFLLSGGSLAILPAFEAVEVIRAIEKFRITYLTGVPAMYRMILAETETLTRHDVTSVRYAVCGSAEVPDELLAEFQRVFKAPIAESYGLTEGGPVPIFNTRWGMKKRGSCGREVPGSDVRLVGPGGADVAPGETGEMWVRNPGLAAGYWKRPDETAARFRDGWLRTGDLFRKDAEGYFYFLGRTDDMINVSGEKVYPKEVEDILLRHPDVRDACVVPAPHDSKGEVPIAFVVTRRPEITFEELKAFYLRHGAPYAYPRRIQFLEALPLNGAGKTDRATLKAKAREEP